MANKITLLDIDVGVTLIWVRVGIALSGSYVQFTYANNTVAGGGGGGEVMDFTTLAGSVGFFGQSLAGGQPQPNGASPGPSIQQMFVYSAAGNFVNQYSAATSYQSGQTLQYHAANNIPLIITTAVGTQLGAGAYSTPVTTDVIEAQFAIRKLV